MSQDGRTQPLPPKEAGLFRSILRCYEQKLYKKGLKACEQILKKYPNHGETIASKSLILSATGKIEDALELCREGIRKDVKSSISWHIYGLLWRQANNKEEAVKAYRMALRLKPADAENQQVIRDLALLQIQTRDCMGLLETRKTILGLRPTLRQNWTALAIAHHINHEYVQAERVLTMYEQSLKKEDKKENEKVENMLRYDIEHQEAAMYRNQIIGESGEVERALEHLDVISQYCLDKTAVLEMRAEYYQRLGKKDAAERSYRMLIERNPEHRRYYAELEKVIYGDLEDRKQARILYDEYIEKFPKADSPRRILLDILVGDEFQRAAGDYLRFKLEKGVPSTFANIKALYGDDTKRKMIFDLVSGYQTENGSSDSKQANGVAESSSQFKIWTTYFLAQHYNHYRTRDTSKAFELIDQLLEAEPENVEFLLTKARTFKHSGDTQKAMETMDKGRSIDKSDRYINTKTAKYQLRNSENNAAIKTMSLFTRNDGSGGTLGDLLEMQCLWYLTEDAESYVRQGNLGLALKRFHQVGKIFDDWQDDQFDFHTFSLRKGMVRAYVEMLRWEDNLRSHPFYFRAAVGAIKIYLQLAEKPHANGNNVGQAGEMNAAERKKAAKKAKREQQKAEEARKAAEAKEKEERNKNAQTADGETKKEPDTDPLGYELVNTTEPLEAAMKWLQNLMDFAPARLETQVLGYHIFERRQKWLLALKCVLEAKRLDPNSVGAHEIAIRLRNALISATNLSDEARVIMEELNVFIPIDADLNMINEEFLTKHAKSPDHVFGAIRIRKLLDPDYNNAGPMESILDSPSTSLPEALEGFQTLKSLNLDTHEYVVKLRSRWPTAKLS